MSSKQDMTLVQSDNTVNISESTCGEKLIFTPPSPVPTRRARSHSQSERAKLAPLKKGILHSFCRKKGHGFIMPEKTDDVDEIQDLLFVHISDVDGEYVPKADDAVTYRTISIPPCHEKLQAVHVVITNMTPGVTHERWDSPFIH